MGKPYTDEATDEAPALLTKRGRLKPAGLLAKKPTLSKFGSAKANGLPRKSKM